MEIRTKFNFNDRIYTIDFGANKKWYVFIKNCSINNILVSKDTIEYKVGVFYFYEQNCFATKEQAQKECERRNGK